MSKKVCIVGGGYAYGRMFERAGYQLVASVEEADIVQFTGGSDVSPQLYGEHSHESTWNSEHRDAEEQAVFRQCVEQGKFIAGICRGGQFLNVMNGGTMYQDVFNHAIAGTHPVMDLNSGEEFPCTSTHHQMMRIGRKGTLLAQSSEMRSTIKLHMTPLGQKRSLLIDKNQETEAESIYYPETRSFCFQPHPEMVGPDHPCQRWYLNKLESLMNEQV